MWSVCDFSLCVNDGYCSSDLVKLFEYKCVCSEWFKGKNCEGRIDMILKFECMLMLSYGFFYVMLLFYL